ncbi:MAG: ATP-binding protein [Candidatus Moraniibacteriota bacterium]
MYVEREITSKIKPFLERKEVISIIGPRQSGKTTLVKHLTGELEVKGKKVKFITFEKKADLALFQDSIEDFKEIANQFDCVVIDEFQYAKDGGQKLKYLFDTTEVKFIITGSSSLEIKAQTGKYMVGRIFDFELLPFSFREYLSNEDPELFAMINKKFASLDIFNFKSGQGFGAEINKRIAEWLEKYVVYGGYPAVAVSLTVAEKKKVLESISDNYLLKEIRGLLNLETEDELVRLQKFLATQIGNLIKYEELTSVAGLNNKKLMKHLNILEKTYIIKLIKPFFTNKRTELMKNPKSFFMDLGMRNYLLNDFRPLAIRSDAGAIMENYALNSLQKTYPTQIFKYWRTKSKAEVDFIVEKRAGIIPIEIKYSSKKIIGKSLHSFIEKFNPPKVIILTKDFLAEEKIKNCQVQFIPLGYF